jgi:hypothetical protein
MLKIVYAPEAPQFPPTRGRPASVKLKMVRDAEGKARSTLVVDVNSIARFGSSTPIFWQPAFGMWKRLRCPRPICRR